ncbi:MAG TPA: DUF3024 domain-containing protein [Actinomycetota bacterium]
MSLETWEKKVLARIGAADRVAEVEKELRLAAGELAGTLPIDRHIVFPMSKLPDQDVARVRRWVDARNESLPERAIGQIRYEMDVDPRAITLRECRPPWREDFGPEWTRMAIARLRYAAAKAEWTLYWCDRNEKSHVYDLVEPSQDVDALLAEVDADPTAIFWG